MLQRDNNDKTETLNCLSDHKSFIAGVVGVSFFAGCLVTGLSMGLGFAYYLRSREKENYKAYEVEMATDETMPLDDESEIFSHTSP